MNITNHDGRAVTLAPGDQGAQVLYYSQEAVDPYHSGPRVYNRFYHDHRYQVYATNEHEMPPQHSKAKICHFWCQHEIDTSLLIQRTWYYVPWSDLIPGVLQDDGNISFTDPVSGHTIFNSSPVPAGFGSYHEGDTPFDTNWQTIPSSPSFQLVTNFPTPNLGIGSSRSRSSESCGIIVTPRSEYSIPGAHRSPTNRQIPAEPISQAKVEQLRRGGAVLVSQLTESERIPTRAVYEREGGEGGRHIEVSIFLEVSLYIIIIMDYYNISGRSSQVKLRDKSNIYNKS
ncbi:hypothetical protein BHYA_0150g00010 [Botrytis hyacinthi]|uniref:Uncharacterized protein n=1 Tax=Botrytis hyacinthi TaxID=278943 RepID=A0A4Z1GF91_9HELO|nr:hypothetical protein BHYA_0150g00010 [Botrytis hyacinthi]